MGLAAIIKNDAFRVLGEDLDEGLGLGGLAGRKGGVAHVHRVVCKTVGQTAGPCRALDAVLGHIDPAVQPIEVSAAAEHHGGGGQCAGTAPALLEVESDVHVQVHGQRGGQQRQYQCQRQHQCRQFFPCVVRCNFHLFHLP